MTDRLKPRAMPTPTHDELQAELRTALFSDNTRWTLTPHPDSRYSINMDVGQMEAWQRLQKIDGEKYSFEFGFQARQVLRNLNFRFSGKDLQLTPTPGQPDQWKLSLPASFGRDIEAAIKQVASAKGASLPGHS